MSLPSKYGPGGLSEYDQSRVITVGTKRPAKPINYIHRTIDDKIQSALHHIHKDEDIEMVPFEDAEDVDVITSYVDYLRGNTSYEQDETSNGMIIDQEEESERSTGGAGNGSKEQEIEIDEGNISYLILDTNFLISHLKIVDRLKTLANDHGLKLIIPVYVIQELDGLKNSNRIHNSPYGTKEEGGCLGESIAQLAKWANNWVYNSLINSRTIVKGQKLSQRIDKSLIKDDAILDCCLYFKDIYPSRLTIVLSNDKNLCAKALTNDVLTVSFRPDMSADLIAKTVYEENVRRFGKLETKVKVVTAPQPQNPTASREPSPSNGDENHVTPSPEWVAKTQQINKSSSFEDVSYRVYKEIQTILLSALHHCMVKEYEDDLDLVRDYDEQSIITIRDCADVLIRFWSIVFSEYFRATPDKFVPFHESDKQRKYSKKTPIHVEVPGDSSELHEFVLFWTRVLSIIYDAVMSKTDQDALEALIARWTNMADMF